MSINQEKRPVIKTVKVRVKRTSENSCVSPKTEKSSESPDVLETLLPQALELETAENKEKEDAVISVKDEENRKTENEPIVFITIEEKREEAPRKTTEKNNDEIIENKTEKTKEENITADKPIKTKSVDAENNKRRLFTPFPKMSFIRKSLVVLSLIFCLWSLLPLVKGIFGIGLYAPLCIGLFVLFTVGAWDFIASVKSRPWKLLWFLIAVIVMIGAAAFAFVSGHMISASNNIAPSYNNDLTVVVLGCRVYGDKPSKMLRGRLDKAADYLLTHPGVNCIVSGGMGSDEDVPESVVMKQYLIKKGVSASRIKIEDESHSTRENIKYSIEVAEKNNYYTTFYIVTDRFHQLRANIVCRELGVTSYALSCETPWYLTMYYWFREMFGIAHHTVYKN